MFYKYNINTCMGIREYRQWTEYIWVLDDLLNELMIIRAVLTVFLLSCMPEEDTETYV